MPDKLGVGTFIEDQVELISSGLDLFSIPEIDNSVIHGKTVTYYPIGAITNHGPYEFFVPHDGNDYTFMPLTRLEGEVEIKKSDGNALADADLNAYVNLFPQTLFRQIEVELNKTQICDLSTPTYPYKAYIETHLSYGDDAKKTHLVCECYEKETVGQEEVYSLTHAKDRFKHSHTRIKQGKIFFSMILHIDFFQSNKYLLPGCNMNLKFIRSDDTFSLLGADQKGSIHINDLRLTMRKVTVDPEKVMEQEKTLETIPAMYPITQSKIKNFTLPAGTQNEKVLSIYRGKLPRSMIICFVKDIGFNGSITGNPFKFEHFDLSYLNLFVNGEPVLTRAFQPKLDKTKLSTFVPLYRWFLDNIGIAHENETNDIYIDDFASNSFFIPFDFSPDLCNNFHPHGTIQGNLDLQLTFKTALAQNIQIIIYSSFNETISIDKFRNVTVIS